MNSTRPASHALRFSIDDYPERERIEALREIYGRTIIKHDIEPAGDQPVRFSATLQALPGLGLALATCSGIGRLERTGKHIDNDDLVFNVSLTTGRLLRQRGRDIAVARGECVVASAEPGVVMLPAASRFISVRLPRQAIAPLIADHGFHLPRLIPRESEALQLLVDYAKSLWKRPVLKSPELQRLAATHVYDLAALAIGTTRDAAEVANDRGGRAARLQAIKNDILENIGNAGLSIAAISGSRGISPRSIQLLFEADGTTFTEFVLGQRLASAHQMLLSPRFTAQPISAIAYEVGFGDLSYFNRVFRRRFGETPSEVRAAARQLNRSER